MNYEFFCCTCYDKLFIQKRDLKQVSKVWRRTRDSNPRGCYTLLAFQASSLATRSILHIKLFNCLKSIVSATPLGHRSLRSLQNNYRYFAVPFLFITLFREKWAILHIKLFNCLKSIASATPLSHRSLRSLQNNYRYFAVPFLFLTLFREKWAILHIKLFNYLKSIVSATPLSKYEYTTISIGRQH